mgnify:CR=1 FL=1
MSTIEETEVNEATETESAELTEKAIAEKSRLESLLCQQSEQFTEAACAFNAANEDAKTKKKHLDSVQTRVNETVQKLTDVLSGRWTPDPQKELPFEDESEKISSRAWRSEPITSLDIPKVLKAKLEAEEITTLGALEAEISASDFAGLDFTQAQIDKIRSAFELWQLDNQDEST